MSNEKKENEDKSQANQVDIAWLNIINYSRKKQFLTFYSIEIFKGVPRRIKMIDRSIDPLNDEQMENL